jgi:enediyne biosynthesis thioesterase
VLRELQLDLQLFTLNSECEFFANVGAFDELSIRMKIEEITQTQIQFSFDYVKLAENGGEQPVGRGYQRIVCMRGQHTDTVPCRVPEELQEALAPYTEARSVPASRTAEPATQRTGV